MRSSCLQIHVCTRGSAAAKLSDWRWNFCSTDPNETSDKIWLLLFKALHISVSIFLSLAVSITANSSVLFCSSVQPTGIGKEVSIWVFIVAQEQLLPPFQVPTLCPDKCQNYCYSFFLQFLQCHLKQNLDLQKKIGKALEGLKLDKSLIQWNVNSHRIDTDPWLTTVIQHQGTHVGNLPAVYNSVFFGESTLTMKSL